VGGSINLIPFTNFSNATFYLLEGQTRDQTPGQVPVGQSSTLLNRVSAYRPLKALWCMRRDDAPGAGAIGCSRGLHISVSDTTLEKAACSRATLL
jgi:hypothetical protein